MSKVYAVYVHGALWYTSDSQLLADAWANSCKQNGWTEVVVKESRKLPKGWSTKQPPKKSKTDLLMETLAKQDSAEKGGNK